MNHVDIHRNNILNKCMKSKKGGKTQISSGRTLSDADVAAIAAELRAEGVRPSTHKQDSSKVESELMQADRLLAKTFGPTGRIGRHGEPSPIPPARPKRLVVLKAGHRKSNPNPLRVTHQRVSNQVRSKTKPASESNVPFTRFESK
jgi:hypothetical protein